MPQLSVVIPTYNALGQVEPLLNQLELLRSDEDLPRPGAGQVPAPALEVIVADDASPDGTAVQLAERFPWLTVVANPTNRGFGANAMSGAQAARGEYIAFINSDVELVGDPFPALLAVLEANESIFSAMPLIYNTHLGMVENLARLYCHRGLCWHTELPAQATWTAAVRALLERMPRPEAWQLEAAPPLDAVLCGAAFACRRDQFLRLGGFDPRYQPFYWEDVGLGYQALAAGQRNVTVPGALVIHRHSESISRKVGERKLRYLLRNQLRFVQAHRSQLRPELKHEHLWWLLRSGRSLLQGDLEFAGAYLKAALGL